MRFRKFAAALLTAAFALNSCMLAVFAATPEQRATLSDLSVQVKCTSTIEVPQETLYLQLTGLDGAPMPEDYAGDFQYGQDDEYQSLQRYSFETAVTAGQQQTLIEVPISQIVYTEPGVYLYHISQIGGSDPDATYDQTAYLLKVTASWENEQFGLTTVIYELNEDGAPMGEKLPQIKFDNHYAQPVPPEVPTPELPEPPEVVPEETPAEQPAVTPEKLIQTGQLNWPVPVLAGAGALLMAAGVLCLSKRKDDNA